MKKFIDNNGHIKRWDIIPFFIQQIAILVTILSCLIGIVPTTATPTARAEDSSLYGKYAIGSEIVEARQENSKTYYLGKDGDGLNKYSIDSYIGPIHYKDDYQNAESPWEEIYTTINDGWVTDALYELEVHLTGAPGFHIVGKEGGEYDVRLKDARVSDVVSTKVSPDDKVVPIVEGNTVTWPNYYPYVDIVLTASNGGVRLERVIRALASPREYDIVIDEISKGRLTLLPLQPATDSIGQKILMEEKPTVDGRTETLKLQVISEDAKLITWPITDAVDIQTAASSDDCYRRLTSSYWSLTEGLVAGAHSASAYQYGAGMRFLNVTIPNSATITVATVTFTCGQGASGVVVNTRLSCEGTDDAATFSTSGNFDTRFATHGTRVDWDAIPTWYQDTTYVSPSIVTPVQEVIDRAGWVSGNDIVVFWEDFDNRSTDATGCKRIGYDWDSSPSGAPLLHVEYTSTAAPTITISAATSIEETTATLNGNVTDTGGEDPTVTVYWGTSDGGTNPASWSNNSTPTSPSQPQGVASFYKSVTSLSKGTLYYVSAKATNTAGTDWPPASLSFLTKPDPATSFQSTDNGTTWISLSWTNGTGMDYVEVRYLIGGTPPSGTDNSTGTLGYWGNSTSANVSSLSSSTQYSFRIYTHAYEGGLWNTSDNNPSCTDTTDSSPPSGDATTTSTLTLLTTYECVSVYSNFIDDDDEDNTATLRYRTPPSSGDWLTGMAMSPDYRGMGSYDHQWRASILGLSPNTQYEVEVTYTDSDGIIGTNPVTNTVTTRTESYPSPGNNYYVATTGSDITGTGTIGNPWETIQYAENQVSAGDTINIRVGTYDEAIAVNVDGNSSNYVYFKNYSGESVTINATGLSYAFDITGDYVRISGLTTVGGSAYGIRVRGHNIIVENNTVIDPKTLSSTPANFKGIEIWGNGSSDVRDNTIQYNDIYIVEPGATDANYSSGPGVVMDEAGKGHVIRYNNIYFQGTTAVHGRDGINNTPNETYAGTAENVDIHGNYINGATDDGISLDGGACNVRSWENEITRSQTGFSVCPILIGPTYVFRNVIYRLQPFVDQGGYFTLGLKDGHSGDGHTYIYQNTFVIDDLDVGLEEGGSGHASSQNLGCSRTNPDQGQNVYWTNNIFETAGRITASYDVWPKMDYDLLYNHSGGTWTKWDDVNYNSFALFVAGTNQENNGIEDLATFADEGSYNFQITSSSVGIDDGLLIQGFNDSDSLWPYTGLAPDMGAYEYEGLPSIETNAATNVEATTATLNGELIDTGSSNSTIVVYWGDNDGGTNPGSWDYNSAPTSPSQPQGDGTFYKNVTSLSTGTTEFFTASATNGDGTSWATTKEFLTKPAAPTNVAASDGTYNDRVNATWTKSTSATGYQMYRDGTPLGWLGDVATGDDTGASASIITPGTASASDNTSTDYVTVSLAGESIANGTTHTYVLVARNATGESGNSASNTGYRGHGTLTYQWQRSAADSDANYSNISGATTDPYNDTGAPSDGSGRYYKCVLSATGAPNQTSTSDRGYRIAGINHAPVLDAIGNKSVNENALLQFTIHATDSDNDTIVYSITNKPSGADLNTSSGLFTWTPSYSQAGVYDTVEFAATDSIDIDSEIITITVNNVNRPPVLAAIGNKSVTVNATLQFTISATDPDSNPMVYSASNLPSGASFNGTLKQFLWIPSDNQTGTYNNVHFQVTDNGSLSDSEDITITVNDSTTSTTSTNWAVWVAAIYGVLTVLTILIMGLLFGATPTTMIAALVISILGIIGIALAVSFGI